jgi:hypothetical protein
MVSVPKVYRGQWRSFAVSHSWESVGQGHEAVTEKSQGGFNSWQYKDENGGCPWWIVKISWVQIRREEYRVIEQEMARRLHSDLKW